MGVTNTTSNNYAPGALNQYSSFMKQYGPLLSGFMSNPFGNSAYSLNLSQNMGAANQQGQNVISNAMSNFNSSGFGGAPSGARTQLMSSLGRYGSSLGANAFLGAANNAVGRQNSAINSAMGFNPLVTGNTQSSGGLGTWLPQVAGMAASAGMGFATGGASLAGGIPFGSQQGQTNFQNWASGGFGGAPIMGGGMGQGMSNAIPPQIGGPDTFNSLSGSMPSGLGYKFQ